MSVNLKSYFSSIEPIFQVLTTPLKNNITTENVKNAFALFPSSSDMSKVTDFDGVLCKINTLRLQTNKESYTLQDIMEMNNK